MVRRRACAVSNMKIVTLILQERAVGGHWPLLQEESGENRWRTRVRAAVKGSTYSRVSKEKSRRWIVEARFYDDIQGVC